MKGEWKSLDAPRAAARSASVHLRKTAVRGRKVGHCLYVLLSVAMCTVVGSGCGDALRRPSVEELTAFQRFEAAGPSIDMERIQQTKPSVGPYRVVGGDVLRLEIPQIVAAQWPEITVAPTDRQSLECRASDQGTIVLPLIGPFPVVGKSLAEIESGILAEYYPKYMKVQLPVYVSVQEYKTERVSVVGAVAQPGIYALRSDQMSLVALLMQAGNVTEKGATVIRITRAGAVGRSSRMERSHLSSGFETEQNPMSGVQAAFSREGPLKTTGWLTLDGAETRIRRWLDIGSRAQRTALSDSATGESRQFVTAAGDLDMKLTTLAAYLESDQGTYGTRRIVGWQETDNGRFVASLSTYADDHGQPRESPTRSEDDTSVNVVLPVKGLNIPFMDVALQEGDSVVVEPPQEQFVSVIGLVRQPGNMPYPPDSRYNVVQAIAFAGGLDLIADPRYVTVYRLRSDGTIASVTFEFVSPKHKPQLGEQMALPLRPGDVVSVEHTPRTRTNVFFDRVLRVSLGLYLNPDTLWNND